MSDGRGRAPLPRQAPPVRRARAAGFTLLEVLVAFAILSVAVVAVIQGFAQGLRLLKQAGDHQQATLLADQKLREIVTPVEGQKDQGAEGAFRWERTITGVDAPDLARVRETAPWRVYRLAVRVRWGEGDARHVELAALRTSAEKPDTPGGRP